MKNYEVFELLKRIDNRYIPTEKEKHDLSEIKEIKWRNIKKVPNSITLLVGIQILDLSFSSISATCPTVPT